MPTKNYLPLWLGFLRNLSAVFSKSNYGGEDKEEVGQGGSPAGDVRQTLPEWCSVCEDVGSTRVFCQSEQYYYNASIIMPESY